MIPGTPGKITPETLLFGVESDIWYQTDGVPNPKWGSSANNGLPDLVFLPETTQSLLPFSIGGRSVLAVFLSILTSIPWFAFIISSLSIFFEKLSGSNCFRFSSPKLFKIQLLKPRWSQCPPKSYAIYLPTVNESIGDQFSGEYPNKENS